jgi:probable F420-dependent oxidoreductase
MPHQGGLGRFDKGGTAAIPEGDDRLVAAWPQRIVRDRDPNSWLRHTERGSMPASQRIRFGIVNETLTTPSAWRDLVDRAEGGGVDSFVVRDHIGIVPFGAQLAPFAALAAAAERTTRLRLGTMVLTNDLRHPALVAQEAATIDWLSGGRFELGIGAGWQSDEYSALGVPFEPPGTRITRLEESLAILDRLLRGEEVTSAGQRYQLDHVQLPVHAVQPPRPPLLIAGGGPRMLRLAGRVADIVGILPAPITGTSESQDPADRSPEAFDRKVAILREAAASRDHDIEISIFATVVRTNRRRESTENLIRERGWQRLAPEDVWAMPSVLIGTPQEMAETVQERRQRHSISYWITSDSVVDDAAAVIAAL